MPYNVNFTDTANKLPITVFDNTSNTDTSLKFPGRSITGYGQIIADNFLQLLENFASSTPPIHPIEGQLWYDSLTRYLMIWDNTAWQPTSDIHKSLTQPSIATSKVGELWVDITSQQLKIFTGSSWILIGPSISSKDGLSYGTQTEELYDSDGAAFTVLINYVASVPVSIISKDTFSPNPPILGFNPIMAGLNLNASTDSTKFLGGNLPSINGTAVAANSLMINGSAIGSSNFMRSDVKSITDFELNIRHNNGLTIGSAGNLSISTATASAQILNTVAGSSIDLQTKLGGLPSTIVRILNNKVGINKLVPTEALDVTGNIKTDGIITSSNFSDTSITTTGGISIAKGASIGGNLSIIGNQYANGDIAPVINNTTRLGTVDNNWKEVNTAYLKSNIIITNSLTVTGTIVGTTATSGKLSNSTTFQLSGDISSNVVVFDGQQGGYSKIFTTTISPNIINNQAVLTGTESTDSLLIYRPGTGLRKTTRAEFINEGNIGVPAGTLMPFAGEVVPAGYLLCNGAEVDRTVYSALFAAIGELYKGAASYVSGNSFRLPDLRGRMVVGNDTMGGVAANRIPSANLNGTVGGSSNAVLSANNLPDHSHYLSADTSITNSVPGSPNGFLHDLSPYKVGNTKGATGTVITTTPNTPINILNPYVTISYIIRTGVYI